jgi:hypothetical protein
MKNSSFPVIVCTLLTAALFHTSAQATLIANLHDDFSAAVNGVATPGGTWTYLWNQPEGWSGGALTGASLGDITTAPLNDPSKFALLQDAGSLWTGDGNTVGNDSNPDRFVRLGNPQAASTSLQMHPGAQATFDVGVGGDVNGNRINGHDRYAIAAFTVNAPGRYQVSDGELWTIGGTSNGVDVWAFASGQAPSLLGASTGGTTQGTAFSFTYYTGPLNAGDTIYVAYGTNGNAGSDGSFTDFSVSTIPEPSVLSLILVGLFGLTACRRRG